MRCIEYPPIWKRIWNRIKRLFRKRHNFESFVFPIIKNMDYQSSIKDIVQVEPMNVPDGTAFYMDFKYNVGKTPWYKRLKVWIFGKPSEGCCR